jgi:hypothetical protein
MKYRYTKIGLALALVILAVDWFIHRPRPPQLVMVVVDMSPTADLFPTNRYQRFRERQAVPLHKLLQGAVRCSHYEEQSVKEGLATIARVEKEYGSGDLNTVLVYTNCSFWRLTKLFSYGSGSNVTYIDLLDDRSSDRLLLSPAILRSPIRVTVSLFEQGRITLLASIQRRFRATDRRSLQFRSRSRALGRSAGAGT